MKKNLDELEFMSAEFMYEIAKMDARRAILDNHDRVEFRKRVKNVIRKYKAIKGIN